MRRSTFILLVLCSGGRLTGITLHEQLFHRTGWYPDPSESMLAFWQNRCVCLRWDVVHSSQQRMHAWNSVAVKTTHTLCRAHVRPSSLNHLVSSTVSLTRLPSLCELFRVCESLYFSCASDSLRSLQSRMRGKLETTVASSRLALLHANIPKSRKSEGVARQYT